MESLSPEEEHIIKDITKLEKKLKQLKMEYLKILIIIFNM